MLKCHIFSFPFSFSKISNRFKNLQVTRLILPERERLSVCRATQEEKKKILILFFQLICKVCVCGRVLACLCERVCVCVRVCAYVHYYFFRWCPAVGLIITFSIFLCSLSQKNFSLGPSRLFKDYSGRQRKYCQRYL